MRPTFEVYLTRRSASSAFAPDAYVFPGGTIDDADTTPAARARTLGLETVRLGREFRAAWAGDSAGEHPAVDFDAARALLIAALRELFEEAGVLLARTAAGRIIDAVALKDEAVSAQRARIRNGNLSFADFLAQYDWYADGTELTLFSHWITPPSEPRRYNTHFFLAAAPLGQAALADAVETHDGLWIAPREALARHQQGQLHLVYPTIKHLERLVLFDSVDAALAFAKNKAVFTIVPTTAGDDFAIPEALEDAW